MYRWIEGHIYRILHGWVVEDLFCPTRGTAGDGSGPRASVRVGTIPCKILLIYTEDDVIVCRQIVELSEPNHKHI